VRAKENWKWKSADARRKTVWKNTVFSGGQRRRKREMLCNVIGEQKGREKETLPGLFGLGFSVQMQTDRAGKKGGRYT